MRFLALLFAALCSLAQAETPAPAVTILGAEFGIFETDGTQEIGFVPSNVVPHVEQQRYGWMIRLYTPLRSVTVREEYLIDPPPRPAETVTPENRYEVRLPRRNQVSQRQLVPVGGRIIGEWAVGPLEPPGKRHMQVFVEGVLAGDFEFEVKPED